MVRGKNLSTKELENAWSRGLTPVEVTIEDLLKHAQAGFGFAAFTLKYPRKGVKGIGNFGEAELLVCDIDGGVPLNECLNEHGRYIKGYYTSTHHQKEYKGSISDRYRIIMDLGFKVTDPALLSFLYRISVRMFGHDSHAVNHNRQYFGNESCQYEVINDAVAIDWELYCSKVVKIAESDPNWWIAILENRAMEKTFGMHWWHFKQDVPLSISTLFDEEWTAKIHALAIEKCKDTGIRYKDGVSQTFAHFDHQYFQENCQFWKTIESQPEAAIFAFSTSIVRLRGGLRAYKEKLKKCEHLGSSGSNDSVDDMLDRSQHYPLIACTNFCPYSDQCQRKGEYPITQQRIKEHEIVIGVQAQSVEHVSLDMIRRRMRNDVERIINENKRKVYLLVAPTGCGKTETVKAIPEHIRVDFCAPTHALLREVNFGIRYPEYPDSLKHSNQYLFSLGLNASRLMDGGALNNLNEQQRRDWADYCEDRRAFEQSDGNRRSYTHEKAHSLMAESNAQVLIVDEDCTNSFLQAERVSKKDLELIRRVCDDPARPDRQDLLPWIDDWLSVINGQVASKRLVLDNLLRETLAEIVAAEKDRLKSNLLRLDDHAVYLVGDEEILYSVVCKFTFNGPIIVMSATANEKALKFLAQTSGYEFERIDYGAPPVLGQLTQYANWSFSKSSMKQNPVRKEQALVLGRKYLDDGWFVIGDKFIIDMLRNEGYSNDHLEHFGNVQGTNRAIGRNLLVMGTPYPPLDYLQLMAATMGLPDAADMITDYHQCSQTRVSWKGFEFPLRVPSDSVEIHQLMISYIHSQIAQATGRARYFTEQNEVVLCSRLPQPSFKLRYDIEDLFPKEPSIEAVSEYRVSANGEISESDRPSDDAA